LFFGRVFTTPINKNPLGTETLQKKAFSTERKNNKGNEKRDQTKFHNLQNLSARIGKAYWILPEDGAGDGFRRCSLITSMPEH
jgi:hypothetical protein